MEGTCDSSGYPTCCKGRFLGYQPWYKAGADCNSKTCDGNHTLGDCDACHTIWDDDSCQQAHDGNRCSSGYNGHCKSVGYSVCCGDAKGGHAWWKTGTVCSHGPCDGILVV